MSTQSILLILSLMLLGCAGNQSSNREMLEIHACPNGESLAKNDDSDELNLPSKKENESNTLLETTVESDPNREDNEVVLTSVEEESDTLPALTVPELIPEPLTIPQPTFNSPVELEAIISSVYSTYPLLESARYQRLIASGQQLSAWGAYDVKLKASSENTPEGFYDNYRQQVGLEQQMLGGGSVFGGYRIGRGSFEPWYQERQTNGGGEFKAGVVVPLAKDRTIDEQRSELWQAGLGTGIAEADIQAQLIGFVQEASYTYWDWVAAGQKLDIAKRVLKLAESRNERIESQLEEGLISAIELTDNLRLVAERKAKVAEARQKLQKAAIKLSLYYRDLSGNPIVLDEGQHPEFPKPSKYDISTLEGDSLIALDQRPEMAVLELVRKQLSISLRAAENEMRPTIDTKVVASKDMGEPTSSKNDKGPFVLEAGLFMDVPIQRRKAEGKIRMTRGKLMQNQAKRRITADKIVSEVQSAYAGMMTTYEQVEQTLEAVKLAEELAERERLNNREGISDLLKVTLREQYAVEASEKAVDALNMHFKAQSDYRAAIAQDRL